jgi:hypothetical protein
MRKATAPVRNYTVDYGLKACNTSDKEPADFLQVTRECHSDPALAGEESQINLGSILPIEIGRRCFAPLNMTAP